MPLEIDYLDSVAQFQDETNQEIFGRIKKFRETGKLNLDHTIDKRKYTYLKKWITEKLAYADVDVMLSKLLELEKKVLTDQLYPDDEKQLLGLIKNKNELPFYFMRTYELIRDFRSFLLIRLRHQYLEPVNNYLETYRDKYNHSRSIFDQLETATQEITHHYFSPGDEPRAREGFLKDIFFDESIDGYNRYLAIVRLSFLYYNYNQLDKIESLYDRLDAQFASGMFYSRRILANYYSNRLILHARLNQLETAEQYGWLSIKDRGSDYIHYLNNLGTILLRQKKNKDALALVQQSIPELKKTMSYHNRVGFASLLIKTLNANNKAAEGESYGKTFFTAYREKVLEYRWHSFFSAWLQSLVMQEKYDEVVTLCHRYKILEKEDAYSKRPGYLPTISWYYLLARYKIGKLELSLILEKITRFSENNPTLHGLKELKAEISDHLPQLEKR
jgi:hypothetical protein